MRILVLGGTQFIGRHIVEAFLAAGHAVTILTRGRTPDELPPSVERLRGDRDAGMPGLSTLAGCTWDACVDVSGYTPRQVRPSAELLRDSILRYVFVSAVRVYGDTQVRPVREDQPVVAPAAEDVTAIDNDTYGPLKVACEQIVRDTFGERAAVLRPQIVVGPHDPTGRYTYWVNRVARGGEILAPGDGTDHVQVIDVRDLARFVVHAVEQGIGGTFNMAGPRLTWADFMQVLRAQNPVWGGADILESVGVASAELPLYRPEHGLFSGLMDIDTRRAGAAGLILTDPAMTARDTYAWSQKIELPGMLSPDREAELIRRARQEASEAAAK